MTDTSEQRTYGGWVWPRSYGLPGFGTIGTIAVFTAIIGGLLAVMFTGITGLCIWLAVTVPLVLLFRYHNRARRDGWQIIGGHWAWTQRKRRHTTTYVRGRVGKIPHGDLSLPGLLADSELLEAEDSYGNVFGVVHLKGARHYTALIAGDIDGSSLIDQSTHDSLVAHFGDYLASLGYEDSLLAATVTVDASPDPGHRLAAEIDRLKTDDGPELSHQILDQIRDGYPKGAATIRAHVALTFTARQRREGERELSLRPADSRRPRDEAIMCAFIGERLPHHISDLETAGMNGAHAMTPADITEHVRSAFDPQAATAIDACRADGDTADIGWAQAGPTAAITHWSYYQHDGAVSSTYEMVDPPHGAIQSKILQQFLGAHDRIDRKRVTFIYQPHDPASAPAIADRDRRTAYGRLTSHKGEAKAEEESRLEAARQSAREQQAGAGLTRLAILATATAANTDALVVAAGTMTRLARSAQIALRPCYGVQDSAFTAALGVGVVLTEHTSIPAAAKEWM